MRRTWAFNALVGWHKRVTVGRGAASSEAEIGSRGAKHSSEMDVGSRGSGPSSEAEMDA
jgi:hypothetical protein